MPSQEKMPSYRAYLLRFWETRSQNPHDPKSWRFSLEDLQTKERKGFANLEMLVAFLEAQTDKSPDRETD